MSLYRLGLASGGVAIPELPEEVTYAYDRYGRIVAGFRDIRRGEGHFYNRGIVGANTPGIIGSAVDGAVGLILDVVHVLLIMAGAYVLWHAIKAPAF